MIDILLINPGDRKQVYQSLGIEVAAIEPPFWIVVMAAYLRNKGFSVNIIDANAENITPAETAARTKALSPMLTAVIVYGSQPSASTQNMTIAGEICRAVRNTCETKIALGGLHPSALPQRTLEDECVDFVIDGEGLLTLEQLLTELRGSCPDLKTIDGLWWRATDGSSCHNSRAPVISDLDAVIPVGAWDLLPMHLYKAHNWHCFDHIEERQPYAAIFTSLGCPFKCSFCCINAPFGKPQIRYRGAQRVLDEIGTLVHDYGVKNLKIVDELFILHEKHYVPILEGIFERRYDLNMWVYARIDTIKEEHLNLMKRAGVNWIALGIESANPQVRDGSLKQMRRNNITEVVRLIQDADICVIGNYIFGLPGDTTETMQETLDMAIDLNCEFANFYSAMAYPGSKLYTAANLDHLPLPDSWHGYSQHAYDTTPLPTDSLTAAEVLKFRDDAFHIYFENPTYLAMLEERFGIHVRQHIEEITKTRLKRKLLDD